MIYNKFLLESHYPIQYPRSFAKEHHFFNRKAFVHCHEKKARGNNSFYPLEIVILELLKSAKMEMRVSSLDAWLIIKAKQGAVLITIYVVTNLNFLWIKCGSLLTAGYLYMYTVLLA